MSDEKALLAAVWEHPHEDAVRFVFADWLDEQGGESNAARAELIRVQIEVARLDGDDPRYDPLESRAAELLAAWERRWWKEMPAGAKRGRFARGFPVPDLGQFSLPGMVKLGEKRLRAAPLWRYHYGVNGTALDALLGWPFLHRLELFAMRPPLLSGWADRMAECPNLRNVSELALLECLLTPDEVRLLFDAWAGRALRNFAADLDVAGLLALGDHPTAAGLRSLRLTSSRLTPTAIAALTRGRRLTGLTHLSLGYNAFGDEGLAELLRWPGLRKLRWLGIDNTGVTTTGVESLAACPDAANLRTLWLSSNPIEPAGALAVATSPHLAKLKRVSFYGTAVARSSEADAVLRKRFGRGNY